jgi:uncharacterized protein
MEILTGISIFLSFLLSASCGLGGSLILIPALTLFLGVKEGIVLSSVLLGLNNLIKMIFYSHSIRWHSVWRLMLPMCLGAVAGALIMVEVSSKALGIFLLAHICLSFWVEHKGSFRIRRHTGMGYAGLSGFCSGLSGTSGPLKGLAVKCYHTIKPEVVASASILSLSTDAIKSAIYLNQLTVPAQHWTMVAFSLIMMPLATY